MATAGQDFGDYRRWLEAAGVDTTLVKDVPDKFTASFFCSTDTANNQIASFYTGAMAHAGELSFRTAGPVDLAIISPNDPGAMTQYADECRTLGIGSSSIPASSARACRGEELTRRARRARTIVICNDYELELIRQKTRLDDAEHSRAREGARRHAR